MPKLKPETIQNRKDHILHAALTCFASVGYSRTTIDDIVEKAELSKGSIYTHFESKKALFIALLEKMLADTELLTTIGQPAANGKAQLDTTMQRMMAFTASPSYNAYSALLVDAWTQAQVDEDIRLTLANTYNNLRNVFIRLIYESIERGEFKATDAPTLANIFIAIFDGLMVQRMLEPGIIDWPLTGETIQTTWRMGLLDSTYQEET